MTSPVPNVGACGDCFPCAGCGGVGRVSEGGDLEEELCAVCLEPDDEPRWTLTARGRAVLAWALPPIVA